MKGLEEKWARGGKVSFARVVRTRLIAIANRPITETGPLARCQLIYFT